MERFIVRRKAIILAMAAMMTFGVVAMGCACGGVTEKPEVGALAPDFTLSALDGQSISLSDLRGKPVVLNFWTTWCGPCCAEMPLLQEVFEEWPDVELSMFLIDIAERSSAVKQFVEDYGLSIPVLLDSRGSVAVSYGVEYIPATFFIDKDGIIRDVEVGPFSSEAEVESRLQKIT